MSVQHLDIAGRKMVVLTQEEFARIAEAAENYDDICAAVSAQERADAGEEYVPMELVNRIIDGEPALKVWREYRSLTQEKLGEMVKCQGSWIAKLENGRATGDVKIWRSLAEALNVDLDDIVPSD